MKQRQKWACALLGAAMAFSIAYPKPTEAAVGTLAINGTTQGELTAQDADDTYDFTLSEAGRLTLDLSSAIDDRALIVLTDSYNDTLYSETVYGDATTPGRDVTTIDLEKGEYQFKIYDDYGRDDLGTYTIKTMFKAVATQDREPNNGTTDAQPLAFGKTTKGYLSALDNKDVYRVELPKAGRLRFDFSSAIDDRVIFQLTDEYNTSIFSNEVYGSWNNPGKYNPYLDLEAGVYYLNLYDDYGYDDTGVYELKSTFIPALDQEAEPNNGSAEAKAFPFYQTRTGFLSWNDRIDVYKVTIPKTSKVGIDVTSYVDDRAILTLYDTDNVSLLDGEIYGSTKAPGRFNQSLTLTKGTYYVSIRDDYGADDTGKYLLRVTSSHLLPTVIVNAVNASSTKVTGKTEKGAAVTMTIGKKSYKRTADSKGNYSFTISKQKVGTAIKISSKNKYGTSVKMAKVTK